jgi:3-hydroxyisobutyrate dehydrogenase-like beta-hydroxyacid dehydrogenase
MKVGFVGLGHMGSGMAANLLKAGHEVLVYNRTPEKAQSLLKLGAKAAAHMSDLSSAAAVITMLSDDAAVESVTFGGNGLLEHLAPGAVHISSSTISVALAERLAAAHAKAEQKFVSAPVFGRPDAAAAGKLFVVAAGSKQAVDAVAPLFDVIGQRTFVIAEEPQLANLVKLSGNFLIACVIETLGEAMALVEKGGVDKRQYLEILTSTLFGAPIYKTYGGLIADRTVEPAGFAAHLGLKDIRLTLAAAEALQAPLPVGSLLRDRFLRLLAQGGGSLDWSAIAQLAAQDAGQDAGFLTPLKSRSP